MELTFKVGFWLCIGAVVYNYVGYPIVLYLLAVLKHVKPDLAFVLKRNASCRFEGPSYQPSIAVIISAFNEEGIIESRIKNLLEMDYPSHLTEILIGLDAPDDSTADILRQFESYRCKVFNFHTRRGKLAVISDLAQQTSAEILVFTDANTMFGDTCVANLVRHFIDARIGAVSGEEIRISSRAIDPGAEGFYWRYESALKIMESWANCLHSVNGGVYAIRRQLFRPRLDWIVEDFQIPLELRFQGHRIVYDPAAISVEEIAPTFTSQFERRIRIGAGNFQTLFTHPGYLNPFKGLPAFAYWSHRVLRWLTPFLLIAAFIFSIALSSRPTYRGFLGAQCLFYSMALLGYWMRARGKSIGLLRIPLYFCSMNLAFLFGFFRFLTRRQSIAWAPTPRQAKGTSLPSRSGEG